MSPSNQKKLDYYSETENRKTRDDLKRAVELVNGPRIAVDCGCGAGSDIAFLRSNGYKVYAFDIEPEAVNRCKTRFASDSEVVLSQDSFSSFSYPKSSLVVADASLFFCSENDFTNVWNKITDSLSPEGVFVGSFLGPEDTMAGPDYDRDAFWPDVMVASEQKVKGWLGDFEIESFTEHKVSDGKPGERAIFWHVFSVVARKKAESNN